MGVTEVPGVGSTGGRRCPPASPETESHENGVIPGLMISLSGVIR